MKDSVPVLYANEKVAQRVTEYSHAHSTPLPKTITDYHDWAIKTKPEMSFFLTSNFQSQCHIFLARMIGARRVLEVGVYLGYSAMVWSQAVGPSGRVTGLEFEPEFAKISQEAFARHGVNNIDIIVGDALQTLPGLSTSEPNDLVFIDAQKSAYPAYLSQILAMSQPGSANRLLRPGGLIVADNVLRRGLVADQSDDNSGASKTESTERSPQWQATDLDALRTFNKAMVESERLETFMLPLYDGVGIARLIN